MNAYNAYNPCDMITERIAIGNFESPYNEFDVIVNLNYPFNGVTFHEIKIDEFTLNKKEKYYVRVGIPDSPSEDQYMAYVLNSIIPKLITIYRSNPHAKFLFHCFAGISRSTTLALALLSIVKNISIDEAYQLAKQKRFIIQPNSGFYHILKNSKL